MEQVQAVGRVKQMRPRLRGVGSALALGAGLLGLPLPAVAEVRVSPLIGDHMVLQRDREIRVFGSATPGEVIEVSLAGASGRASAGADGRFEVRLPPARAGGPYRLKVKGRETLEFEDVFVGEVFVASGQSNMEWPLFQSTSGPDAASAGCPGLRLFTVRKGTSAEPVPVADGRWSACDATTAPGFSGVAFFFGQELHRALGVTVGLIQSAWGGTPAEAWTSREALLAVPQLKPMVEAFDQGRNDPSIQATFARRRATWEHENYLQDPGNKGFDQGWARLDFDDGAWKLMTLPRYWESAGLLIDGSVWFRRTVEIPSFLENQDLLLSLGPLDDFDQTYWNGITVGETNARTPQHWTVPRRYRVPRDLVRPGRNVIAVRIFDQVGNGGFAGSPADLFLTRFAEPKGGDRVALTGEWRYAVELGREPVRPDYASEPPPPASADNPNSPTGLWNAMVTPLTRFPVRAVIWYQGESNATRAFQYRTLFPTLIESWRSAWGDPTLGFLFVQLDNYMAAQAAPGESEWAELREAQARALALPATGMAVAIDVGEANDIHPKNKREVGRRLALAALARVFGRELEYSGPTFSGSALEDSAVRVRFTHAEGLSTSDGETPKGFAVAGRDRVWHWATGVIDHGSVMVFCPEVKEPVAVRYAWADNPAANLTNAAGLPAAPFRTDDWPLTTAPKPEP
jgi:sialate O-acetylesterase